MLQPTISQFSLLVIIVIVVALNLVTETEGGRQRSPKPDEGGRRPFRPDDNKKCAPCDKRRCPLVTPDTCQEGVIMKDDCDCCPVCHRTQVVNSTAPGLTGLDSGSNQTRVVSVQERDACASVDCGKHQVCIPNIQNIPMCRCRSKLYCRRAKSTKKEEVCGDNGILYKNKCYLEVDECEQNKKIRISDKQTCLGSVSEQRGRDKHDKGDKDKAERKHSDTPRKRKTNNGNGKKISIPSPRKTERHGKKKGTKADTKVEKNNKKANNKREHRKEKRQRKREQKLARRKF